MVFGVVKMNQFYTGERVKDLLSIDGKMEQYESPWVVLPGDD